MNDVTYKQVIVMRTDLNMRKGKMIAQGAHASSWFMVDYLLQGYTIDDRERHGCLADAKRFVSRSDRKRNCKILRTKLMQLDWMCTLLKTKGILNSKACPL